MTLYLVTILVYLVALVGVGALFSRRVRTGEDFMVAGRSLGVTVLVGTLLATWIGSGSIIASAGLSWRVGFAALWGPSGAWLGILVLYFIAGRARRFGAFTVPDMLEARYNALARVLGTLVTVVAYTVITSYQFRAGGMVLRIVAGVDLEVGIAITAVFVIAYTALAGMLSVAYTDLVNGVILTVGILVTLGVVVVDAGGFGAMAARVGPDHLRPSNGEASGIGVANLFLPTLFLLLGESNMYSRFFSARSAGVATRAVLGWIVGVVILETAIVAIGVTGRALYPNLPELYPQVEAAGSASELVIPHMIVSTLHPWVGALLLAAVAAVIVSTGDSFLLTPSTNLVHDVWTRFVQRNLSPRVTVWLLRGVVVILGAWAYMQVTWFPNVLQAALYAYTMYGAGITPAVLAAFFWKRATPAGGAASVAAGMIVTLVWEFGVQPRLDPAGLGAVDPVIPALLASVLTLVGVSLLTAAPGSEKWVPFFRVETEDAAAV
ncbi:MAG: sodium:solute symporter family protein [Gemmatimonadetes bacterium]|nr:sodium:solute symporter family protein [Gemmatimonadota bacterium]